ncbi:MAG: DMT family transporter [Acidimicrobiia bacterium]|nr:DMT family transporter [Acidimicrobiia bacterium]
MRNRVVLAVLAASLGWGLAGVGTRAAFELGASTVTVLTIRTAVATAALTGWAAMNRVRPSPLAWRHGSLVGVLRIGLAPLLFMASLNYISAGVEGLIITLVPATTALMAAALIQEHVTQRQVTGLIIGLIGTSLIALAGDSGLGAEGDVAAGFALAGAGVLVGSLSGVLQRKYAPLHDTTELAAPMFVSGLVVALVAGLIVGFDDVGTYDAGLWALLVALGLGSTLLPFGATLYASKHATATVVSITAYLAPLVGVIGGVLILGEELTPVILLGAAFATIGVALVGGPRRTQT